MTSARAAAAAAVVLQYYNNSRPPLLQQGVMTFCSESGSSPWSLYYEWTRHVSWFAASRRSGGFGDVLGSSGFPQDLVETRGSGSGGSLPTGFGPLTSHSESRWGEAWTRESLSRGEACFKHQLWFFGGTVFLTASLSLLSNPRSKEQLNVGYGLDLYTVSNWDNLCSEWRLWLPAGEGGRGATLHYHVVRKFVCWFERLQKRSARHLFSLDYYTWSFFRTVLHVAEAVPYVTRQLLFITYVGSNLVGSCIREPVYKERKTQLIRSLISLSINLCFHSTSPVINIHTINGE